MVEQHERVSTSQATVLDPSSEWRSPWVASWVERVEVPLLVMAVLMIPLLVVPAAVELSDSWARAFLIADIVVWAAFAIDFGVRLWGAKSRGTFVRHNWVDIVIIAVPFLRPLRIVRSGRVLRLLRLTRLGAFIGYAGQTSRELLKRHNLKWVLLTGGAFTFIAAFLVWLLERNVSGSRIHNLGDAMWWSVTTATTVNYGDAYPSSGGGKIIAVGMMVVGVVVVTNIAANLAARYVDADEARREAMSRDDLKRKLDEILARLDALDGRRSDTTTPMDQRTMFP